MHNNLIWKQYPTGNTQKTSPIYVSLDRAFSLLERIKELNNEDLTSSNPKELLKIFKKITEAFIQKLLKIKNANTAEISEDEKVGSNITIRSIVDNLSTIHANLRYIHATKLERNPSEMVLPWELLINKHFEQNKKMIIRPQWRWGYKYQDILGNYSKILESLSIATNLKEFPVFSFPSLERDNIMLHVILAHEIGHFIEESHQIAKNIKKEIIINKEKVIEILQYELSINKEDAKSLYDQIKPENGDFLRKDDSLFKVKNEIDSRIEEWLQEITSDLIALRIVGPAYFFALLSSNLNILSEHHNLPSYKRLIILFNECKSDETGYFTFFNKLDEDDEVVVKIKNNLNLYFQEVADIEKKESDIYNSLTKREQLFTGIISDAVEKIINKIKAIIYIKIPNKYILDESIFDQIALLKKQITPNQQIIPHEDELTFNPFSMESILNAGWLFWLTHFKDVSSEALGRNLAEIMVQEKEESYVSLREVSSLLLRAIELSNFQNEFNKSKIG